MNICLKTNINALPSKSIAADVKLSFNASSETHIRLQAGSFGDSMEGRQAVVDIRSQSANVIAN
jgi:hypothetical protein